MRVPKGLSCRAGGVIVIKDWHRPHVHLTGKPNDARHRLSGCTPVEFIWIKGLCVSFC